jgi:hypothetical protein
MVTLLRCETCESLAVGRVSHAVLLVGHFHPVALGLAAVRRLGLGRFGIAWQKGDGVLVGIHFLEHFTFTIPYGVPETVGTCNRVGAYIIIGCYLLMITSVVC